MFNFRRLWKFTISKRNMNPSVVITGLVVGTIILVYACYVLFMDIFAYMKDNGESDVGNSWLFRLFLNLLGYGTIILPGILLYYYAINGDLLDKSERYWFSYFLRELYLGSDKKNYVSIDSDSTSQNRTFIQDAIRLGFCSVGLLSSYLIWGLEQEKIMTQEYKNGFGDSDKFQDSQFLVFVNRILAVAIAGAYTMIVHQPRHTVPYYKYIYCAFSNVMSSWCQYEALKFISYPTQVISKTCKIIPVMLMGKIVSKRKYDNYEYVVAFFICIGMVMFLMGSPDAVTDDNTVTTFSGIVLIVGYMVFDSFTSNWQSELFNKYSTTSIQMMCGVNLFSALLTTVSLLQQGSFFYAFCFTLKYPAFLFDCVLLSICSAIGQLFVYYTISCFGPVIFIIIMTVRQGVSIIVSCITYNHFMNDVGIIGILLVFFAIFLRIYCSHRKKILRNQKTQLLATCA